MGREILTEDRVYHLDPANAAGGDGLSAETAFSSLPEAYAHVEQQIDLGGRKVTFLLADGIYTDGLSVTNGAFGGGEIHIQGKNEEGAKIEVANGQGVTNVNPVTPVYVSHVWLPSCAALFGGRIYIQQGISFTATGGDHMSATYLGMIFVLAAYAIRGTCSTHIHAYTGGIITINDNTQVWPVGTLSLTRFLGVADASVVARNLDVRGSINCHTYLVHKNGFADLENANLPGSGEVAQTGGIVT
jgi:hypothetical protein